MLIRCPECHFERNIDTAKIPATATVATCPKCGKRFRFRDPHTGAPLKEDSAVAPLAQEQKAPSESSEIPPQEAVSSPPPAPHLPTEQEGDDPLPPGAVIPKLEEDENATGTDAGTYSTPATEEKESTSGHSWFGRKKSRETAPDSGVFSRQEPLQEKQNDENKETVSSPVFSSPFSQGRWEGIPWEQPERYSIFRRLYYTMLGVLFHPREFFSQLRDNAPLTRPAIFYVLLSLLYAFMTRLWSVKHLEELLESTTNPQTLTQIDAVIQRMNTPLVLLATPFLSLAQLFISAVFYHLMFRLVQPDRANFNTVVRVIAYSSAPLIFYIVPVLGANVGSLWCLICTFIGCKYALGLSWGKTALALVPLFLLALSVMLLLFQLSGIAPSIP